MFINLLTKNNQLWFCCQHVIYQTTA